MNTETNKGDNAAAKAVGKRIKELRKEQRMSKTEVATRAGMKVPTLTAIEEGRYNTGIRQITDIAHALGAQIAFIPGERLTHDGIEGVIDFI